MTEMELATVPLKKCRIDQFVSNSRFIGSLSPVSSVEEAREFIQSIRNEFADASHNVPAFIIGHGASKITHCSDDGEPSGSAGRPALAVLQGSGLGDVAVVITRYFGGTKLGIGGLVKAYSNAVREVLLKTTIAYKLESLTIAITFDYSFVDRIRLLITEKNGLLVSEEFEEKVHMSVTIPLSRKLEFINSLSEMTRGSIILEEIEYGDLLVPI